MADENFSDVYRYIGQQDPGLPYDKMRQSTNIQTKPNATDYLNQFMYDFYSDTGSVMYDPKEGFTTRPAQSHTNPVRIRREDAAAKRYPVDPEMGKDIENDARRIQLMSALEEIERRNNTIYHSELGWDNRFPNGVPNR